MENKMFLPINKIKWNPQKMSIHHFLYIQNVIQGLLFKSCFCPLGHPGLECNDSWCTPPRQIATDPHGFSRAHTIRNGLFNFPQGALPLPHHASLKMKPLLGLQQHCTKSQFILPFN